MLGNYVYRRPFDYAARKRLEYRFRYPVFASASLSVAGTSTPSFAGQSTAIVDLSSAGVGTPSFVAVSGGIATASMAGTGALTFVGGSLVSGTLSVAGVGAATFTGGVSAATTVMMLSIVAAQNAASRRARLKSSKFPYEDIDRRLIQFPLNNAPSVFSIPGIGSFTAAALPLFTGTLSGAGTSTVSFSTAQGTSGTLAAAGTSAVSWSSSLGSLASYSMAGTSTMTMNFTATGITVLNSQGVGALSFFLKGNASPRRKGGRKRFFRFLRS